MAERATPKPERSCAIPPRRQIAAAAVTAVCLLLCFSSAGFANSYSKGNWSCIDFKAAEQDYRTTPENIYSQLWYAHCLITRGGDDHQGLNILHNIVDNSTEPARVKAAWMLANYIKTGGTFENTTDENNINEAIEAYKRIVFFIDLDPKYPEGNSIYEEEAQIELKTHYRLPLLYFDKFKYGSTGSDHMHLLNSPSYNGDRDLNTYPEYSPYTINSLNRMIEFADICLALPHKRHFIPRVYEKTKAECQVLKETAQALLPLERQRLVLLDTESCSIDLLKCDEYNKILLETVNPIIRQANSEIKEIIQRYAVTP